MNFDFSWSGKNLHFRPLLVFCSLLVASTTLAESKAKDPVSVPASFLASRLVRPVGAPANLYRVVVDVPPAPSPRAAKPRVAESCGDSAVDGIATDYVRETLRKVPGLEELNRAKELRFPLRLAPLAITLIDLNLRAEFKTDAA